MHFVQVSLWLHHGHLKLLPLRASTALVTFCNMILLSCLLTCSWAVGGEKTKERPQRKHFLFPRQLLLSPGLKQNPLLRINRTWARNFRGKDVTQGHISGIVGTVNQWKGLFDTTFLSIELYHLLILFFFLALCLPQGLCYSEWPLTKSLCIPTFKWLLCWGNQRFLLSAPVWFLPVDFISALPLWRANCYLMKCWNQLGL